MWVKHFNASNINATEAGRVKDELILIIHNILPLKPTSENISPCVISDLIIPGVTIVIPISGPISVLNVSKKDTWAALLA